MKQIPGFPNYCVTKDGRVWSKKHVDRLGRPCGGCWLKPYFHKYGYPMVRLYGINRRRIAIHTLVLETYVGPRPNDMGCRHLNGDPIDNRLENLCWGTQSENIRDAVKHKTHPGFQRRGRNNPNTKLTEDQVRLIFNAYHDGAYFQKELAEMFNVSPACIQKIANKQMWSHLWN